MGIQPVHEMNCVPVRRWTSSCHGPGRGTLHDEQVGKPILRGAYERFFTCRVQCPLPWPKTLCQPTAYLAEVTSLSPGLPPVESKALPLAKNPRQPTAYLAEVTSLSPGLPPQRLPRVTAPQARPLPCQGSFPHPVMVDRWATMIDGPRKQSLQDRHHLWGPPTRGSAAHQPRAERSIPYGE